MMFFKVFGDISPIIICLFILPMFVLVMSFVTQLIFRKKLVILAVNFIVWVIATFTLFNESFFIYCFLYTIVALAGTFLADFTKIILKGVFSLIEKRAKKEAI